MASKATFIGLGVMGFADLVFTLGVTYDSDEALALAERYVADASVGEEAEAAVARLRWERLGDAPGPAPSWTCSADSGSGPR